MREKRIAQEKYTRQSNVNNTGFHRGQITLLDHLYVSREKQKIILKKEEEKAEKELLPGKDVKVILPTGFCKILIFTIFAIAKERLLRSEKTRVLVISPLKSIIDDHINKMASLNYRGLEFSVNNIASILSDPPQFVYCTAEKVLEKSFLNELENSNTAIHKGVSAIVVGQSHTVESWAGKR